MKKIIFGFSRPIKWKPFAKLIMWADSIDYDHAYTKFPSSNWGTSFIYQNSGTRTNFKGEEVFLKENIIVEEYEREVTPELEAQIGMFCLSREGKPYGIIQVIGKSFCKLIFIITKGKIRIKNKLGQGDAKTDCIEEQAQIIAKAFNISPPIDLNTSTVKPYRDWVASNFTKVTRG